MWPTWLVGSPCFPFTLTERKTGHYHWLAAAPEAPVEHFSTPYDSAVQCVLSGCSPTPILELAGQQQMKPAAKEAIFGSKHGFLGRVQKKPLRKQAGKKHQKFNVFGKQVVSLMHMQV